MSRAADGQAVAVVCGRAEPLPAVVQAFLRAEGIEATRRFAPRDLAELDEEARAGRVRRIVFASAGEMLDAIWSGEMCPEAWPEPKPRLESADGPPGDAGEWARLIAAQWASWQRRYRRRQAVAGLLLSAVVLVVSFAAGTVLMGWR